MLNISQAELQNMLNAAGEEGARRALERVGLHDEKASKDIDDLRDLLSSYRELQSTVLKTIAKWITMGILGFIALGAYQHFGGSK